SQGGHSNEVYFEERFSSSLNRSNLENWDKLFEGAAHNSGSAAGSTSNEIQTLRFESQVNHSQSPLPEAEKILFQLHGRYVVKQVRSGMMFFDQQLAHERILFERYLDQLKNKSAESQQSLFPQTVSLTAQDFAIVMEMEQEIKALGFRFEVFGKNTLVVNGIPAHVASGRERELFEGLIEQFKLNQSVLSVPLQENLARALAKRASIKSGQKLDRPEMQALIDGLFACGNPNYSPEGRPTFFIFELSKIESYFTRH
ncbi:MAG TPA: DNA mismatch repair protein MutL, partial [Chryseosolibacter sp.]|nr:DNA mismatch repair protein MutL [Chryseosolibacter sp.]